MTDLFGQIVQLVALAIAIALAYGFLLGVYNLLFHPLRSYPGPLLWRAFRFPYARSLLAGRFPFDVLEMHNQYGNAVRVAPNELSYTSSSALKTIYGHHNAGSEGFSEFDKDRTEYQLALNGVWNILGAPADIHGRYRRMFSHAFSEKGMRSLQPRIQEYVNLLIHRLREAAAGKGAGQEKYVDILEKYNWTTFDLIGDLAFGESFHCLENDKTDPWISAVFGNIKAVPFMHMIQQYNLAFLLSYLTPRKLVEFRRENLRRNNEKIEHRVQLGADRGDFWDNVLNNTDFEKGIGMSKPEMVANASILVLGGSETTATLLAGTTYLLLKHPDILKKLNDEVRNAYRNEHEIDLLSVGKLEYMLAVLDEAMRLYPPVPNQGNRVVPKSGALVDGKWVAGGTSVQVQRYASSHFSSNFARPESFIPERWLSNAPTEFAEDDRAASAPFSLGPRNCIGRNLAYSEMRLILAKVCFNFEMELDEERSGNWIGGQQIYGLWEKPPLWIKLRPRQGGGS